MHNYHKKIWTPNNLQIILGSFAVGCLIWFSANRISSIDTQANAGEPDVACIGNSVASYIDGVMGDPRIDNLDHIKFLSPAFNMTSPYFQDMVNTVAGQSQHWEDLDGIAGNAYNFQNGPYIPDHVNAARANPFIGSRPLLLTEIGWYEKLQGVDHDTARTNLANAASWIKNQPNMLGGLLFNVFNNNTGWSDYAISDSDLFSVCGGAGNCGKIGANSAGYYSSSDASFYSPADSHGMGWTIEIANNDNNPSLPSLMPGINSAFSKGITPVIRIGVMDNSGGFDNPRDYVDFLVTLNGLIDQDVWVIVGPNEPITECWAAPGCQYAGGEGCSGTIPGGDQGCRISEWVATGPNVPMLTQQCACPPGSGETCQPFQNQPLPDSSASGQIDGTASGNFLFFDNDIQDWVTILPIIGGLTNSEPPGGPPAPPPPGGCIACPILGGSVGYTYCSDTWYGDQHRGTDYLAPEGTTLYAAVTGEIVTSGWHSGYGYHIVIEETDGTRYIYGHMDPQQMPATGPVTQGAVVGAVGPTILPGGGTNGTTNADHLHFEVRPTGVGYEPCSAQVDPQSITPSECQGSCASSGYCEGESSITNCDPNAPAPTNHNLKPVNELVSVLAQSSFSDRVDLEHVETCYNDLINTAQAGNIDPALAMAMWIEESGASNYCQFPIVGDFGCVGSTPRSNFQAQLQCLIGTVSSYLTYGGRFEQCRQAGCTPPEEVLSVKKYLATFSDGPGACVDQIPPDQWVNSYFYNNLHLAYQLVHEDSDDLGDDCVLPSLDWSEGCSMTTSCSY